MTENTGPPVTLAADRDALPAPGQPVLPGRLAIAFRLAAQLRNGAYDPGPLQYWLLAIPVHLDPRAGVVWGAALCCMVAASLAIEAAWSAFGAFGGLAASGIIVGTVAWPALIAVGPEG